MLAFLFIQLLLTESSKRDDLVIPNGILMAAAEGKNGSSGDSTPEMNLSRRKVFLAVICLSTCMYGLMNLYLLQDVSKDLW